MSASSNNAPNKTLERTAAPLPSSRAADFADTFWFAGVHRRYHGGAAVAQLCR
jgi:hypothetical protein